MLLESGRGAVQKLQQLNERNQLRRVATAGQREETRKSNEEFLKQQSEAASLATRLGDTFLDTGSHKVTTDTGKKVFDMLCKLKRQEQPGMYMRNNSFRQGLVFEVDLDAVGTRADPMARIDPAFQTAVETFSTKLEIGGQLRQKVAEAVAGGTTEKLRELGQEKGADEASESDDGE